MTDPEDDRPGITRWVQYDMPMFVGVEADADGEEARISEVRLVVEEAYLARDFSGRFVVYDGDSNQVVDDKSKVAFDGCRRATTVTEERRDWPLQELLSLNGQGQLGPDPRGDPDFYLTDEEIDEKYGELKEALVQLERGRESRNWAAGAFAS